MKKTSYSVNKNGSLTFRSRSGESVSLERGENLYYIDLFCGAGGVSWGVTQGGGKVIYCINHDPLAIASHQANLPNILHATEDIRNFDLGELIELVSLIRRWNPEAIICLWASLECTHFSKAKGGNHRDGDSRTLAEHLYRYIEALDPDYIDIENVVEFMSWGPLRIACEKMHKDRCDLKLRKTGGYHMVPNSRKNGRYYSTWKETICRKYGYAYDHRILNSADFGALTSRTRYFGQFKKNHLPFTWPQPTHARKPGHIGMFGGLKPWKAVKPALDLQDEGKSIFGRKKDLSDNTLRRIYAGLVKYVGEGKEPGFITKWMSGNEVNKSVHDSFGTLTTMNHWGIVKAQFITKHFSGKPEHKCHPLTEPARTITTSANQSLISPAFLMKYHGNGENILSADSPYSTLSTKDRLGLVKVIWLDKQYSGNDNHQSADKPLGTIMTKDKYANIQVFIMNQFSGGGQTGSVERPSAAITTVPKANLVQPKWLMNHTYGNTGSSTEAPAPTLLASRKHFYLMNPKYDSKGNDLDRPFFTLIARMDKMPPYLVDATEGEGAILIYEDDSEILQKIKLFMAAYGIMDIRMRMLKVPELLRIQGFGDSYRMMGNQTDQKRFIGNSVEVNLAKKKTQARIQSLSLLTRKEAVA